MAKYRIPIPISRYFEIPIPNTEPTLKNTDKNTEYRYRRQIPTPTHHYMIQALFQTRLTYLKMPYRLLCFVCIIKYFSKRHSNLLNTERSTLVWVTRRLGEKLGRLGDNIILPWVFVHKPFRRKTFGRHILDVWENTVGPLGDKKNFR